MDGPESLNEGIISCDISHAGRHALYAKPHGAVAIRKTHDFYELPRKQRSFQKRDPPRKPPVLHCQSHHSRLSNVAWFPESAETRPPSIFLTAGILEPSAQHQEKYQKYGKSAACSSDKRSRWSARRNQGKRYSCVSIWDTENLQPVEDFCPWTGDSSPTVRSSGVTVLKNPPLNSPYSQSSVAVGLKAAHTVYMLDLRTGSAVQNLPLLTGQSGSSHTSVTDIAFNSGHLVAVASKTEATSIWDLRKTSKAAFVISSNATDDFTPASNSFSLDGASAIKFSKQQRHTLFSLWQSGEVKQYDTLGSRSRKLLQDLVETAKRAILELDGRNVFLATNSTIHQISQTGDADHRQYRSFHMDRITSIHSFLDSQGLIYTTSVDGHLNAYSNKHVHNLNLINRDSLYTSLMEDDWSD